MTKNTYVGLFLTMSAITAHGANTDFKPSYSKEYVTAQQKEMREKAKDRKNFFYKDAKEDAFIYGGLGAIIGLALQGYAIAGAWAVKTVQTVVPKAPADMYATGLSLSSFVNKLGTATLLGACAYIPYQIGSYVVKANQIEKELQKELNELDKKYSDKKEQETALLQK
jgi:hypothetical protein